MASISSPGIGSGLDVNSIISKLMALEQQPITVLDAKEASYQTKLSAYGSLKGALSALQTATQALNKPAIFSGVKATVADGATFSATASRSAVPATYTIEVRKLAIADQWSGAFAASNASLGMQAGTLRIQAGTGAAVDVAISADATLADVREAINNARAGVTATIVSGKVDGVDKAQLIITSNASGASSKLSFSNPDGSLAVLTGALSNTQIGADAEALINGTIIATGSNNTISNAIEGLTLTLSDTDAAGISHKLTVARDTSDAVKSISAFVKAYNDLNTAIKNLTAYDAGTKQAAALLGDSAVQSIQAQIRRVLASEIAGTNAGVSRLSDLGVAFERDGSLSLDSVKLQAALNDPNKNVSALFVKSNSINGYASQLDSLIGSMLGNGGVLSARTNGMSATIRAIDKRREALSAHLDQIETRYRKQFSALDSLLSRMNATSSYLTQQLASLSSLTAQGTK